MAEGRTTCITVCLCARRYRPLLTPGFERCRAQLPWWQIYGPAGEPMPAATVPLPPQQEVVAAATA
jgi:hypothetical protein